MDEKDREAHLGVSRRQFLGGAGAAAAGSALLGQQTAPAAGAEPAKSEPEGLRRYSAAGQKITLNVNGRDVQLDAAPSTTLLEALRESLGLTGAKEVCDRGACGACTVLLDGRSVNSCMMLAIDAIGRHITTIEGIGADGRLDPVQEAFIENDACQCGYCIPGFVVRSKALLQENPKPNLDAIKHGLSGNICRCAAYAAIFAAVEQASEGGTA